MKEIFKVSSLVKEYGKGGGKVTALSNVDLNINEGGLIAITGARRRTSRPTARLHCRKRGNGWNMPDGRSIP